MKRLNNLTSAIAAAVMLAASVPALAQSTVFGEGRTPIGAGDAAAIRNAAKQEAMRDAVVKAIKDSTALDASAPKFAPIVNEVAKQLRDVKVKEEVREGNDFVARIEAFVDRRQIKNAIRGTDLDKLNDRSFSILMLVDEFVTSTRDLKVPLRDLTEFSYDAGSSAKDKSIKAAASSSSRDTAVVASSDVNASASSNVDVRASGDRGSFRGQGSDSASYKGSASLNASDKVRSQSASMDKKDVEQRSHETASYRRLVEYQDTSKPTPNSVFLSSFSGNLRDYDLRLQDSSITRSKFFGDRKITLATLTSSAEMAKFAEFARKSNSDFLMVGTSTVVEGDVNPATGLMTCAITAEIKAFATAGGELIAATAESTQAAGKNIEGCAGIASKKIADMIAPEFANRALGYWADRAARGRQYTVEFKGAALPLPLRLAFVKALREIPGASDVEKKEDGAQGVRATLTLKGKADAMEEIVGAVSSMPAFSGRNLDGTAEGEQITLCLESCTAQTPTKSKKK